ncbi:uncharacterized protein E0L32_003638 [Thyridium curvatum]|uniref:Translation machinery-associated protein 17 n=1 Tax=Thyridium curvatum TaxID=1093900 RepID=A0A507BA31_9PEZI|nr:uncharacterized protein E0L32_003638 [Thyridium curvatum]TPX16697.1 hypothetical protein E0L32_003638 [Thyridium curvatum]
MSSEALPISPARFAEALKDLSLSSLHLKVLEIRNSIAHLDYSNEKLRPFATGAEPVLGAPAAQPDQDCVDAIRENEAVISRMQDRIRMVREEVEGRGFSWTEFQSKEEAEAERSAAGSGGGADSLENGDGGAAINGHSGGAAAAAPAATSGERPVASGDAHEAWRDGTFQTGMIRNGEVHMDGPRPGGGGSLSDEQLRRALEERMRVDEDEDDGGMHL